MSEMPGKCTICGNAEYDIMYSGPVRTGRYGEWTESDRQVFRCLGCGAGRLEAESFDYEGAEYRQSVDGCSTIEEYRRLHDPEQGAKLAVLGTDGVRGKVVADIGCGGGAFLDLLKGVAAETVAVEPCAGYHETLSGQHRVYGYCSDALKDFEGGVDVAVSFAVVEHVEDPKSFLEEIGRLLKPGGRLLLSTPNADDWLIGMLPGVYDRFFYRKAHRWYFNGESLSTLAGIAGFEVVGLRYKQRFDISNALHWLRDGRPTGLGRTPALAALDSHYVQHLEETGRADFLYAELRKGEES